MEKDAKNVGRFAGPACYGYQRGTSSMYGSVMDRGTTGGNYDEFTRYPKGLKANVAGTASLVGLDGGTCPFILVAGETLLFKWKAITDSALTHGSSSINNFVIIWD